MYEDDFDIEQIRQDMDEHNERVRNNVNLADEKGEILVEINGSTLKPAIRDQITNHLKKKFNIRKTLNPPKLYYTKDNMVEELNESTLQSLYYEYFRMDLLKNQAKLILDTYSKISYPDNNYINFKNTIWDVEFGLTTSEPIFTTRNIKFDHNPYVEYEVTDKPDTLVQKTLQEILTPKNNLHDDKLYIGFLQRIGSCVNHLNKHKTITIYKGTANQGKGIISDLIQSIFPDMHTTRGEFLKNDSSFELYNCMGANPIIFEELGDRSFYNIQDLLKSMSGGDTLSARAMYSNTPKKSNEFGHIFGFANTIPKVSLHDPGIVSRVDILEFPNTFIDKQEYDKLSKKEREFKYIKNENLKNELKRDQEGLEWLVNAGMLAYYQMIHEEKSFRDKLSYDETLLVLNQYNPVQRYINTYIEKTNKETDVLSNKNIRSNVNEFLEEGGFGIIPTNALSQKIRLALNNKFGIDTMRANTKKSDTIKYVGFVDNFC